MSQESEVVWNFKFQKILIFGFQVVQIVKAENLELVRIEKGNRNSIIFHVIHKPSRKFGQFVLYGYVKNLEHVKEGISNTYFFEIDYES